MVVYVASAKIYTHMHNAPISSILGFSLQALWRQGVGDSVQLEATVWQ